MFKCRDKIAKGVSQNIITSEKDMVSSHQIKHQVIILFCHNYPGNFRKTGKYHKNLVIIHEKKKWFRPTVAKTQPGNCPSKLTYVLLLSYAFYDLLLLFNTEYFI
jgi:hypothetical protein